jgi:NAD(P)-dependent dehydrogenase (short-subunit alcohol dehydrogenase family)
LLAGKIAIVTGGGRGVGRAAALALARHGATVAIAARTRRELDDTAAAITAAGGRALAVPTDIGDPHAVTALVARTVETFGTVDILAACAGINGPMEWIERTPVEAWEQVMRINLTGTFLACRAVLPVMRAQKHGKIVNVASGNAVRVQPGLAAYSASKAAVVQFTRVLAEEVREHGIQAYALHPGIIRSAIVDEQLAQPATGPTASLHARLRALTIQEPEYCGPFFAYLATDAANDLSGQFVLHDDPAFRARVSAMIR